MKKVLLTTTALVMTAGVAAAEVSFSGTAGIAMIDDNGASALAAGGARTDRDGMFVESYYDFDIKASAATDNGITMSLGFDMGAGNKIDYDDDDKLEAQGVDVGDADISVSMAGWTVTVDQEGLDNLFDDTQADDDLMIAGSVAGLSIAATTDLEEEHNSYKLGYTMGDMSLTYTGTNDDDAGGDATKIALSYKLGDLTLKASASDESNDAEDDQDVGFSYKMDALTVSYTTIKPGKDKDFGDEWDAKIAYSAGAMSASYAIDEADASTIIAEFDLGGGATAFAAMHDKAGENDDLTALGINFKF